MLINIQHIGINKLHPISFFIIRSLETICVFQECLKHIRYLVKSVNNNPYPVKKIMKCIRYQKKEFAVLKVVSNKFFCTVINILKSINKRENLIFHIKMSEEDLFIRWRLGYDKNVSFLILNNIQVCYYKHSQVTIIIVVYCEMMILDDEDNKNICHLI